MRLGLAISGILLLGLCLRIGFVWEVQKRHDLKSLSIIHSDTREYISLGREIAGYGRYVDPESIYSRHRGLLRGPVVPLIWAGLLETIGRDGTWPLRHALWLQIIPSMGMVLLSGGLAYLVFRRAIFACYASLLAAVSPTGIAMNGVFLADLPFAFFFIAALCTNLLIFARRGNLKQAIFMALVAGVCYSFAALTKPTLTLWFAPLLVINLLLWLGTGRTKQFLIYVCCATTLPPVLVMTAWAYRNYQSDGLFVVSTISTRNLYYMVAPYTDFYALNRRWPTQSEFRASFLERAEQQDRYVYNVKDASAAGLYAIQTQSALSSISTQPVNAVVVLCSNLINQITRGWESSNKQFVGDDPFAKKVRLFFRISRSEMTGAIVLMIGGIGVVRLLRRQDKKRMVLAMLVTWAYFAVLLSTTRDEGSRLMFPVEAIGIVFLIGALIPGKLLNRSTSSGTESTQALA